MSDEELIAALGWQACRRSAGHGDVCATHAIPFDDDHPPWCPHLDGALWGARAGMDLARKGIAKAIQAVEPIGLKWPFTDLYDDCATIARTWRP